MSSKSGCRHLVASILWVKDCFHTTAKCVFWILIRNAHFELKFERRYFGPCVRQITSRCVIWNAHFKWRSRGVFHLRISQITQQNHCMNALISKSWFGGGGGGGGGAKWPSIQLEFISINKVRNLNLNSNHFRLYTARCICTEARDRSTGNASSMHVWLAGYPDILLPLECKIPNSVSRVSYTT